jgi:phosphonate transport system substrate-binding protein
MRKLFSLLLMVMFVTACGGAAPAAEPTKAPEGVAESTAVPEPTAAPEEPAEVKPVVIVWLPNESGGDLEAARDAIGAVVTETLGRPVEHKLTTDYIIAVEALANDNGDLAFYGAQAYIEAKNKNNAIVPLMITSGASGTAKDALYHAWFAVNKGEEAAYQKDGVYSIENIAGKRFSFVSNSSTSGFKVPASKIVTTFSAQDKWKELVADDLLEGGEESLFSDVQFGVSHQGAAVNLISGKSDVAVFCDTCVENYTALSEGEPNTVGSTYKVIDKAAEPFDKFPGKEFVLISVTPVLNSPFAANGNTMTAEEIKKLQDVLTSDAVANNPKIFATKAEMEAGYKPIFKKTKEERFIVVEDSFFDPIRELSK